MLASNSFQLVQQRVIVPCQEQGCTQVGLVQACQFNRPGIGTRRAIEKIEIEDGL